MEKKDCVLLEDEESELASNLDAASLLDVKGNKAIVFLANRSVS